MKSFTKYPKSIFAADDPDVFVWDGKSKVPSDVKKVRIQDGVTSIGRAAFYHCTSLTSITIPNSVTSIGEYAFFGCTSLTSINIPEGGDVNKRFGIFRLQRTNKHNSP